VKRSIYLIIVGIMLVISMILVIFLVVQRKTYSGAYDSYSHSNHLDNDFEKYIRDSNFRSSNQTPIFLAYLGKDKTIDNSTNIVLTVWIWDDVNNQNIEKNWSELSSEEKKNDLRECAELVEKFLKNKDVPYSYHIYVNVQNTSKLGNYVYDKSHDSIWIPNCEEKIKKGEYDEPPSLKEGYHVCILNSKFTEVGKEESTPY